MIKKTAIKDLKKENQENVILAGFVETIRNTKKNQFIVLRDKTGQIQLFNQKQDNQLTKNLDILTPGSCIVVTGNAVVNDNIRMGGMEVILNDIKVESLAPNVLPIDATTPFDKQMDFRHLSLRTEENQLTFKVQTTLEHAMREFWAERDFIEIHSPKLMGTASESGSEVFEVNYFNKKAYLAQSPQFYKQMVMASGFENVFEIGPVFRAENSNSPRHTTEYTSIDVEFSWVDSHDDVMDMEEDLLRHAFNAVHVKHGADIKRVFGVDMAIPETPFPRIPLADVMTILAEGGHDIINDGDLDTKGEKMLGEYVKDKFNHNFVFVTDYPAEKRAFYHMRHEDKPNLTKSFDLIYNGTEITTGAQREHRIDQLRNQIAQKGMSEEPLQDYLNFFQHGMPPHGGFGIGLTRILMLMLDKQSIKDTTLIPRTPKRATP